MKIAFSGEKKIKLGLPYFSFLHYYVYDISEESYRGTQPESRKEGPAE